MKKYYQVARHIFSLEMQDGSELWGHLGQYDPFVTEPVEDPLFEVSIVDDIEEPAEKEAVYDQTPEPGEAQIRLYSYSEGWFVTMALTSEHPVCCKMLSDKDFHRAKAAVQGPLSLQLFGVNNAAMLMFALSTARLDTLEMHASMVSWGGKAYLFLAKSGTGKSTHSSLWLKHIPGTELMNDDNPVIRVDENGNVIAYGTPWSGKTPCYRNVSAPVGGFVRIRRAQEDSIAKLGLIESYALIYSSCSGLKSEEDMADGIHETLEKTVTTVPCYVLDCLPDEQAARICHACVTV